MTSNRSASVPRLARFAAGLALAALSGCHDWQHDATYHGVTFVRVRREADRLFIGELARDTRIGDRLCRAGWVHLHPSGRPAAFTAAEPVVLPRLTLPAGTWVQQDDTGTVTTLALPADTELQGHLCRGTGGPKGVAVALYPDGALRQFYPPAPVRLDDVPCDSGLISGSVTLHANGRLRSARLAADWTHAGVTYPRGTRLEFDAAGRPLAPAAASR